MSPKLGETIAFGEFIFNTASGELLHKGSRIRMPDQSARLLTIFLENPGVMISREDLRCHLWPHGEFIDHNQAIRRAISQLRAILNDRSSKSSKVIDTLPKRGYRFVVPVRQLSPVGPVAALEPVPSIPAPSVEPSTLSQIEDSASLNAIAASKPSNVTLLASRPPNHSMELLGNSHSSTPTAPWNGGERRSIQTHRLSNRRRVFWATCMSLIAILALWGGVYLRGRRHRLAVQSLTLGIVPFESSGDGAAPLAESFRFDLADSLSRIPNEKIFGLHAFDALGHDESKIQARAQQVGVGALLFGHFNVQGDQCNVQLELIRVRDGVHLFSLHYSGRKEELASIRDRIEADIFQKFNPSTHPASLNLQQASSPLAYAEYLQGRYALARGTDSYLHSAIDLFEKAIRDEPNYARPYAGAASAYFILSQRTEAEEMEADIQKSHQYAAKAIALDPSLAEAHAILGEIALVRDWNFAIADEELHRAVELDPYHAADRQWLSLFYAVEGQYDLAFNEIDKAHMADPDSNSIYLSEIYIAAVARQWDRADHILLELIKKMPNWSIAHEDRGLILWGAKRYSEAIEEWHRAAVLDGNANRMHLEEKGAEVFRSGGVPAYARLRLRAIATHKGLTHEQFDFDPAVWYAYAGDREKALQELEVSVNKHSNIALQIWSDTAFEGYHSDPRFLALVKKVGLRTTP